MSADDVQALRRDLNNLTDELHLFKEAVTVKLASIHQAVVNMAERAWVPGPATARSVVRRGSGRRPKRSSRPKK